MGTESGSATGDAAGLRFGILGPVRAWRRGVALHLGTPRQQTILGLLLVRGGAVVSHAEIVAALWGDRPTPSAANVVHRAIGQLRRIMEPELPVRSAGSLLSRVGAGYRLHVDAGSLDLLAFRALVSQARAADDPDRAVDLFLRALDLWRGSCAAGPAGDILPAFRELEAERTQAVRELGAAALRIAEPARVLAAVRAEAGRHPLNEALQQGLMLVLAADGRREEAFEVYRGVSDRLADQLGVDPDPAFQGAYERLRSPFAAWRPVTVPAHLPSDHPFLVARADLAGEALRSIDRQRTAGPAVLTIAGMPGAGKTTLAIHLGHRLAPSCPDGQLYVDLGGFDGGSRTMAPADVLRGFVTSLGMPASEVPTELTALAEAYQALLAERRVLILLDNCREAGQLAGLLPGTPGSVVVVTTRAPAGIPGDTLHVPPLSATEARECLALRLGASRVRSEPAAAEQIVDRCGRLPLALALVSARASVMPEMPLTEIADDLADSRGRMTGFGTADEDLAAAFSWSYRRLTPAAARLFRLLPRHPGPDLAMAAVPALAGISPAVARMAIGDLVSHALLEARDGRLEPHALLRAYAQDLSEQEDTAAHRADAVHRILHYYVATASAAHRWHSPRPAAPFPSRPAAGVTPLTFTRPADAEAWLTREHLVLRDIVLRPDRHGDPSAAWRTAFYLQTPLRLSGRDADRLAIARAGLAAARADGDRRAEMLLRRCVADALAEPASRPATHPTARHPLSGRLSAVG